MIRRIGIRSRLRLSIGLLGLIVVISALVLGYALQTMNAALRTSKAADLAMVRTALDEWIGVVDAPDEETRVRRINAMLATYADHPRLSNHAGDGWHVHYRPDDIGTGRLVATLITTGTALHLAGRGINRLGRCAIDGCDNVYADLSRTGRQRYCSPACANRDAVRRHRTRARS